MVLDPSICFRRCWLVLPPTPSRYFAISPRIEGFWVVVFRSGRWTDKTAKAVPLIHRQRQSPSVHPHQTIVSVWQNFSSPLLFEPTTVVPCQCPFGDSTTGSNLLQHKPGKAGSSSSSLIYSEKLWYTCNPIWQPIHTLGTILLRLVCLRVWSIAQVVPTSVSGCVSFTIVHTCVAVSNIETQLQKGSKRITVIAIKTKYHLKRKHHRQECVISKE